VDRLISSGLVNPGSTERSAWTVRNMRHAANAHEHQTGDVDTRDEQHDANRAQQYPEHTRDIPDDLFRERTNGWRDLPRVVD
jgi:hypothetical protein